MMTVSYMLIKKGYGIRRDFDEINKILWGEAIASWIASCYHFGSGCGICSNCGCL